jgi:hypothetical protein
MSLVTLVNVRNYTADDVYHYTVDARPIQDLESNDQALQTGIDIINSSVQRVVSLFTPIATSSTASSASHVTLFVNQVLTANITIAAAASPISGDIVHIVRSSAATGAFNVTFASTNLTAASSFITWQYDGSNWHQIGHGTLI